MGTVALSTLKLSYFYSIFAKAVLSVIWQLRSDYIIVVIAYKNRNIYQDSSFHFWKEQTSAHSFTCAINHLAVLRSQSQFRFRVSLSKATNQTSLGQTSSRVALAQKYQFAQLKVYEILFVDASFMLTRSPKTYLTASANMTLMFLGR